MKKPILASPVAIAICASMPALGRDLDVRERKAVVIAFAPNRSAVASNSQKPSRSIVHAMIADFNSNGIDVPQISRTPEPGGTEYLRLPDFVRTPVAVPQWMRDRSRQFVGQAFPTEGPVIGDCGSRSYVRSGLLKASSETRRRILYPLIVQSACRYGLPVGLFDAMIIQESRYNTIASSPKGAFGLGQLMPGTAAQLGVDRYSIYGNLNGAARYLSGHLREFRSPSLALAAYNAGPGRVRSSGGIPRISETQNYVRQILMNWRVLE